jgi:hypothetical protein
MQLKEWTPFIFVIFIALVFIVYLVFKEHVLNRTSTRPVLPPLQVVSRTATGQDVNQAALRLLNTLSTTTSTLSGATAFTFDQETNQFYPLVTSGKYKNEMCPHCATRRTHEDDGLLHCRRCNNGDLPVLIVPEPEHTFEEKQRIIRLED